MGEVLGCVLIFMRCQRLLYTDHVRQGYSAGQPALYELSFAWKRNDNDICFFRTVR